MRFKPTKCSCASCRAACQHAPCWPTPEEAARLQAAHPGKVAYERTYWYAGRPVAVLRPAAVGERAGETSSKPYPGRCVFYTGEGKCELHYTDLKPLEGRCTSHEMNAAQRDELRRHIGRMWNGVH